MTFPVTKQGLSTSEQPTERVSCKMGHTTVDIGY